MKLSKVKYELYELDESNSIPIELDRQIILEFENSTSKFISWSSEHQHTDDDQPYSLAYSNESFFTDNSPETLDVSSYSPWKNLIGKELIFDFLDDEFQVLSIRNVDNIVFCYTDGVDKVKVSDKLPKQNKQLTTN